MNLLKDIRVASFNHMLMGPAAAQYLADLGADVISVEPTGGAFQRNWAVGNLFVDGQSVNHLTVARNKRSLALDLKAEAGKEIARRLVRSSDVVMENFRPGSMEKLGTRIRGLPEPQPPDHLRFGHRVRPRRTLP